MTEAPPAGAHGPAADPLAWFRAWETMWRQLSVQAPRNLTQPILGGWTVGPSLTINAANSSSPQTESDIVARYSYGRQLGRITDAMSALVERLPPDVLQDERLVAMTDMARQIDAIKLDRAQERVELLLADLSRLKDDRPEAYERLRAALRRATD